MAVCLLLTALLYRDIRSIGRLSVVMWTVVIGTVLWITITGSAAFRRAAGFRVSRPARSRLHGLSSSGLGGATLIAMYDYGGYNNVCFFAGEVKQPERVIPRSILLSIVAVAALYLTMNVTIIGVVPWQRSHQIHGDRERLHPADSRQRSGHGGDRADPVDHVRIGLRGAAGAIRACRTRRPSKAASSVRSRACIPRATARASRCGSSASERAGLPAHAGHTDQRADRDSGADPVSGAGGGRAADPAQPPGHRAALPDAALSAGPRSRLRRLAVHPGRQRLAYIAAGIGLLAVGIGAYLWRARGSREWPFEAAT